jgi:hypothetical protein
MADQAEQLRRKMNDATEKQYPLPRRFTIREKGRFIEIADLMTGHVAEVPSYAYGEVRRVLSVLSRTTGASV